MARGYRRRAKSSRTAAAPTQSIAPEFIDELELHLWWQSGSNLELAQRYFQLMQTGTENTSPCKPDAATFGALLTACANYRCRGQRDTGEENVEIEAVVACAKKVYTMLCENDRPNQNHLTQMLMVLGNAGKFEEAKRFFQDEMLGRWQCLPTSVTVSALVSLADKAGDVATVDAMCFGGSSEDEGLFKASENWSVKDYRKLVSESVRVGKGSASKSRKHWKEATSGERVAGVFEPGSVLNYSLNLHYLNLGEAKAVLRHVLRDRILADYCERSESSKSRRSLDSV